METTISATKWAIDPTHSEVHFKVKHLVISTVTGAFNVFNGSVTSFDEDFADSEIEFSIDVNSIDTNQSDRDAHLKAADFFHSEKFPRIHFKSTSLRKTGDNLYKLTGNLTIKDVTKEVGLDVEFGGFTKFYGNTRAGFEVSGKINRKEFGLIYNALTETGGLALGEDVKLIANVELVKEA